MGKDLNRHVSTGDVQTANKQKKTLSIISYQETTNQNRKILQL